MKEKLQNLLDRPTQAFFNANDWIEGQLDRVGLPPTLSYGVLALAAIVLFWLFAGELVFIGVIVAAFIIGSRYLAAKKKGGIKDESGKD